MDKEAVGLSSPTIIHLYITRLLSVDKCIVQTGRINQCEFIWLLIYNVVTGMVINNLI